MRRSVIGALRNRAEFGKGTLNFQTWLRGAGSASPVSKNQGNIIRLDNGLPNTQNGFVFSCWIYLDSSYAAASYGSIFFYAYTGLAFFVSLERISTYLNALLNDGSGNAWRVRFPTGIAATDDAWHHVLITVNPAGAAKAWIDGNSLTAFSTVYTRNTDISPINAGIHFAPIDGADTFFAGSPTTDLEMTGANFAYADYWMKFGTHFATGTDYSTQFYDGGHVNIPFNGMRTFSSTVYPDIWLPGSRTPEKDRHFGLLDISIQNRIYTGVGSSGVGDGTIRFNEAVGGPA